MILAENRRGASLRDGGFCVNAPQNLFLFIYYSKLKKTGVLEYYLIIVCFLRVKRSKGVGTSLELWNFFRPVTPKPACAIEIICRLAKSCNIFPHIYFQGSSYEHADRGLQLDHR